MIANPVIAMRRIIKIVIAIVRDQDRIVIISIIGPDPVARDIARLIDKPWVVDRV